MESQYTKATKNIWFPDQEEPVYDPSDTISDYQFKEYWKREKNRILDGFHIADGQVYISGWLYWNTVYWKIKKKKKRNGRSFPVVETPDLRDLEWEAAVNFERSLDEGTFIELVGSRGFGKTVWQSSYSGRIYSIVDKSQVVISGGNAPDIKTVTDMIETGLVNIHPVLRKKRLKNNWKEEIQAGFKTPAGEISDRSSLSQIIIRNYESGIKTMAANGTRPDFHVIDEIGKIPNFIGCVKDSDGCWWAGEEADDDGRIKPTCLPMFTGTGGDMEVGAEAGEMFFDPDNYNILSFTDEWEGRGKVGWFIPATKARYEYKEPKKLSEYLNIQHPDLERITILVSNEEKCLKEWWNPKHALAVKTGNPKALLKFKAYWPLKPSDSFLVLTANDFNIDAAKAQQIRLKNSQNLIIPVTLLHNGEKITHEFTDKLPISQFPVKDQSKDAPVCIIEFPPENIPFGLYTAGVDPYRFSESEYSDSLGAVYIFKRIHEINSEKYSDMFVAWYVARPTLKSTWQEQARLLIKMYGAITLCENDEYSFIDYMISKGDGHYIADKPEWIKQLIPHSTDKRDKGVSRASDKVRNMLDGTYKSYMDDEFHTEKDENGSVIVSLTGVSKIFDPMLLEETIKYNNKKGNFDRIVACFRKDETVLTQEGYKKIQEITKEDKVLTHKGNYQRVLNTSKIPSHNRNIVEIKPLGFEREIGCTEEHPFLVSNVKKGNGRAYFKNFKIGELEWKNASDLSLNDFLLIPKRNLGRKTELPEKLLYLLGWYLSDGNRGRNCIRITFQGDQLNLAEQARDYLMEYDKFEDLIYYPYNHLAKRKVRTYRKIKLPRIYKVRNKYAYNLEFHSKVLNEIIDKYISIKEGGEKTINSNLFNCSNLLPLVLGFLEGDGHQKSSFARGSINSRDTIEVSGTYINLIKQIRQILFDNNIWCTSNLVNSVNKPNSNIQLRLDIQDRKGLNNIINSMNNKHRKFKVISERKQRKNHLIIDEGILIPIKKLKSSTLENDFVYNLEVEDDNSYTISSVATHNCELAIAQARKMDPYYTVSNVNEDPRMKAYFNRKKKSSQMFDRRTPVPNYRTGFLTSVPRNKRMFT